MTSERGFGNLLSTRTSEMGARVLWNNTSEISWTQSKSGAPVEGGPGRLVPVTEEGGPSIPS